VNDDAQVSLNYKQREARPSRSPWIISTVAGIVVWMLISTALFQLQQSKDFRWAWAILGTLLWSIPLGIALAKSLPPRWHALWIAPAAYPLCVALMYICLLGAAAFPHLGKLYLWFNWHEQPGRELMGVSLALAGIPTVATMVAFLVSPRS